jgi:hypothetical protein
MALTPGLSPSIRLVPSEPEFEAPEEETIVEIIDGEDKPIANDDGKILEIEHDDGSITISLDGKSLDGNNEVKGPTGWFDNLVDDIPELELNRISDELLRGISDDIDSRKDWIEDHSTGLKLLGLKIEIPGLGGSAEGAPVEGMNRVRHPLLLEAVLRFQANARSEMLPTDGPVKIRNDDNNATLEEDQLAQSFQRDLNHYLTSTATEYYPDTDRMLFMLGFGGTAFKKVYFCPLRNRPVSESVDADDLIVNNSATDLQNAKRITHRSYLRPSTVKRLQILGVYRDTDLSTPSMADPDSLQREKMAVQGISTDGMNPNDRDREIYECYCELNLQGFEHKIRGKETGLEIPYRVTLDVSSKKVLSVVRNYNEDTKELPEARKNFVKYTYVPGMGFYDIGLLHILGNTTNAITAAWRELLDAGMYANFPGFLLSDTGARQNTNIFRVPPGGGALVKTGGMPISQAVMPLPYKEPSGTLMGLVDNMAQTGMRLGGTSEAAVGEGRQDAPVGTTLAQIEQAQKVLNSVHKRMHAAQAEEFQLLKECFREHPDSFWQRNKKPAAPWDEKSFLTALNNYELIPQADPNTASQVQRLMKVMALKQLQAAQPSLYDPVAIDTAALQAIGWSNPSQFLASPEAQKNPPPELVKMQADAKAAQTLSDARMMDAQTKRLEVQQKGGLDAARLQLEAQKVQSGSHHQTDTPVDLALAQSKIMDSQTRAKEVDIKHHDTLLENENRDLDRHSRERAQILSLAKDILAHQNSAADVTQAVGEAEKEAGR